MKKWFKPLTIGIIIGCLAVPAIGYATSKVLNIEVSIVTPGFKVDGKEIKEDSYSNGENMLPYALNYKGTTYVPIRKLGELMGKRIGWESGSGTISIDSSNATVSEINYEVINNVADPAVPQEIKDWFENTRISEMSGFKTVGDTTYILIHRGEKPTTGYSVGISGIYAFKNQVIVTANYSNPQPGKMQGQMITYPSILVKTKAIDENNKVSFAIQSQDPPVTQKPPHIVEGDLQPSLQVVPSDSGHVQFSFKVKNQTEQVQNLSFENALEYDYTVRNELGQKIAEPADYGFDQAHEKSLKQGEELSYDGGISLKPGNYTVDFYLNDSQWRSHSSQRFVVK